MIELDLRNKIGFEKRPHYWFDSNGVRFGYCYIRKNACTCFKNLICETSAKGDFLTIENRPIDFMNSHHRIKNHDELNLCDMLIFIYRDPYERLISAFLNKFIIQSGGGDILSNYKNHIGDPEEASFQGFISDYCLNFRSRDYHVRPQSHSLLPIKYNSAIFIDDLYESMKKLAGSYIANKYFRRKENKTIYGSHRENLVEVPVRELRKTYIEDGTLPSQASLRDGDLKLLVKERYADDYSMIKSLRASALNVR